MIIKRAVLTVFLFTSLFAYSPSTENLNQRSVSSTFVDQNQLKQKSCGLEFMPFNAAAPDPFDPSSFTRQDRDVEIPINYHVIYVEGDSIFINVTVDNYFNESMWDIRDYDNNTFLLYPGFGFDYSGQSYSIGGVLPPGNYALFLYDDYGDGGVSATVTTSTGEVLASIGTYQWGQYTFLEFVAPEGDFTDGLLSNEDIEEQTDALNSVYNELGYSFYTGSIDSAVNAGWYYATDSHIFDTGNWSNDDQYLAMAEAMTTDVPSSINFFWTGMYNTQGLGVYPWSFPEDDPRHGLACGNYTRPGGEYPFNQGYTGVHEVGHYIGLYHTFENGCSAPGDEVDDTPYQSGPNYGCPSSYYSCGSYDDIGNYMDYMDDNCLTHFTDGQVDRINWALETYRPTLLLGSGENDGVVWHVSTNGSDDNDGSEESPFATIQYGIDVSTDGDTVVIHEGVYYEQVDAGNLELTIGSLFMFDNSNESIIENTILDGENSHKLFDFSNAQVSLIGLTLQNGYNEDSGGAISSNLSDITIINCRFTENYAGNSGGVMRSNGDNLTISKSVFYNNSSLRASVINAGNASERTINVTIIESIFKENIGERRGAINVWASDTTLITNCEFSDNISGAYGGGFIVHDTKYLEVDGCTITDNISLSGGGGGLNVWDIESGIINNSIFSGNTVMDTTETDIFRGGGLNLWADVTLTIRNCTITNNTAPLAGGISIKHNSHCTIINSIIWGNGSTNQIGLYDDLFDEDTTSTLNISFSNLQYGIDSIFIDEMSYIDNYDNSSMINLAPLFCNADSSDYTLAENSPCVETGEDGANMGAFGVGCGPLSLIEEIVIPTGFVLQQNFPNPFNPVTTLRYDLPEQANVNIIIYDMLGRQVRTLVNQTQEAGFQSVLWNATNDYGKPVSAGVYLYQIHAGEFGQTRKMVLLK